MLSTLLTVEYTQGRKYDYNLGASSRSAKGGVKRGSLPWASIVRGTTNMLQVAPKFLIINGEANYILLIAFANSLFLQFLLIPCIAGCMHSLLHLHVRTQNSNDLEYFNTRKG